MESADGIPQAREAALDVARPARPASTARARNERRTRRRHSPAPARSARRSRPAPDPAGDGNRAAFWRSGTSGQRDSGSSLQGAFYRNRRRRSPVRQGSRRASPARHRISPTQGSSSRSTRGRNAMVRISAKARISALGHASRTRAAAASRVLPLVITSSMSTMRSGRGPAPASTAKESKWFPTVGLNPGAAAAERPTERTRRRLRSRRVDPIRRGSAPRQAAPTPAGIPGREG